MSKLLIVAFAIVCITFLSFSDAFPAAAAKDDSGLTADDCRKDEDFLECGTCPKTCKDPNPTCDSQCKSAMCVCKEGTVRATDGQCIPPEECPPKIVKLF